MSLSWNSRALQLFIALVASSWLPTANAYCYSYGYYYDCGLGAGAYAGIAIGIISFVTICAALGFFYRRRRISRTVYVDPPMGGATTTVTTTPMVTGPQPQPMYPQHTGGYNPYAPQYPQPVADPNAPPYPQTYPQTKAAEV